MEKGYYKLDPSELCEGFEYEIAVYEKFGLTEPSKYIKTVFSLKTAMTDENYKLIIPSGRVKYLDHDDILELGWKKEPEDSKYKNVYHLGDGPYSITSNGLHLLSIKPLCNKITIKHPNFIRDGSGRFDGYMTEVYEIEIKNKSELKKLMQQLKINA